MILAVNTAAVLHSTLMIKPFKLLPTSKFLFVVYDLELDLELFLLSYLHSSPQALKNPLKRLAHVLCLAPTKCDGVDYYKKSTFKQCLDNLIINLLKISTVLNLI